MNVVIACTPYPDCFRNMADTADSVDLPLVRNLEFCVAHRRHGNVLYKAKKLHASLSEYNKASTFIFIFVTFPYSAIYNFHYTIL